MGTNYRVKTKAIVEIEKIIIEADGEPPTQETVLIRLQEDLEGERWDVRDITVAELKWSKIDD